VVQSGKGIQFLRSRRRLTGHLLPGAALAAVGLDTLLAGATVDCETVRGQRGPEVSRIHFFTASPRTASFARTPGNGRAADGPGIGRAGATEAGPGRRTTALVKWFLPMNGYGFLEPEDGSPDVFRHVSAVEASGRDTLPQGGVVTCEIVSDDRDPRCRAPSPSIRQRPGKVQRNAASPSTPGIRARRPTLRHPPSWSCPQRSSSSTRYGFGFVVPDSGGREVFVHASVLFRSGMTDLEPGQRVFVRAESVPPGLQATEIEPI